MQMLETHSVSGGAPEVCRLAASQRRPRVDGRLARLLVSLIVAAHFLGYTREALRNGFHPDDLMNLHFAFTEVPWWRLILANLTPFSTLYRPMGALCYRLLYECCGLEPWAYHAAAFLGLGIDLALLAAFAKRLSGNAEIGVVAALLCSFHPRLVDLYANSGTIYDILCFAFYFAALLHYARARSRGPLTAGSGLVTLGLFTAALNAKEVGATLPAALLVYELLFVRQPGLRWPARLRGLWPVWAAFAAAAAATWVRLRVSTSFAPYAAYAMHVTVRQFFINQRAWLDGIALRGSLPLFNTTLVVLLWAAIVAAGLFFRRRDVLFWAALILLAPLPVAFIPTRGLFAVFLMFSGYAVLAATLLVQTRDGLWRALWRREPIPAGVLQPERLGTLVLLAIGLSAWFPLDPYRYPMYWNDPARAHLAEALGKVRQARPCPKQGGKVLFLDDPWDKDEWGMHFSTILVCHDRKVQVFRAKTMPQPPPEWEWAGYDLVVDYRDGRLSPVAAPRVAAPPVAAPRVAAPGVAAPPVAAPRVAAPRVAAPPVAASRNAAPPVAAPRFSAAIAAPERR